jgi:uncharacterized membrane protein YhaH (DUF805 family)
VSSEREQTAPAPGWFNDPIGRHQFRWYDAQQWTDHVADDGVPGLDPFTPPPPPGAPWATPATAVTAWATAAPASSSWQTPAAGGPGGTGEVTMDEAVARCLSKYADFSGRAPRSEYWWFWLATVLTMFTVPFVVGVVTGDPALVEAVVLFGVLALALPLLAAGVRRLHDTGRSGWWVMISAVPLVGPIMMLIFLTERGSPQANRYGPPTGTPTR